MGRTWGDSSTELPHLIDTIASDFKALTDNPSTLRSVSTLLDQLRDSVEGRSLLGQATQFGTLTSPLTGIHETLLALKPLVPPADESEQQPELPPQTLQHALDEVVLALDDLIASYLYGQEMEALGDIDTGWVIQDGGRILQPTASAADWPLGSDLFPSFMTVDDNLFAEEETEKPPSSLTRGAESALTVTGKDSPPARRSGRSRPPVDLYTRKFQCAPAVPVPTAWPSAEEEKSTSTEHGHGHPVVNLGFSRSSRDPCTPDGGPGAVTSIENSTRESRAGTERPPHYFRRENPRAVAPNSEEDKHIRLALKASVVDIGLPPGHDNVDDESSGAATPSPIEDPADPDPLDALLEKLRDGQKRKDKKRVRGRGSNLSSYARDDTVPPELSAPSASASASATQRTVGADGPFDESPKADIGIGGIELPEHSTDSDSDSSTWVIDGFEGEDLDRADPEPDPPAVLPRKQILRRSARDKISKPKPSLQEAPLPPENSGSTSSRGRRSAFPFRHTIQVEYGAESAASTSSPRSGSLSSVAVAKSRSRSWADSTVEEESAQAWDITSTEDEPKPPVPSSSGDLKAISRSGVVVSRGVNTNEPDSGSSEYRRTLDPSPEYSYNYFDNGSETDLEALNQQYTSLAESDGRPSPRPRPKRNFKQQEDAGEVATPGLTVLDIISDLSSVSDPSPDTRHSADSRQQPFFNDPRREERRNEVKEKARKLSLLRSSRESRARVDGATDSQIHTASSRVRREDLSELLSATSSNRVSIRAPSTLGSEVHGTNELDLTAALSVRDTSAPDLLSLPESPASSHATTPALLPGSLGVVRPERSPEHPPEETVSDVPVEPSPARDARNSFKSSSQHALSSTSPQAIPRGESAPAPAPVQGSLKGLKRSLLSRKQATPTPSTGTTGLSEPPNRVESQHEVLASFFQSLLVPRTDRTEVNGSVGSQAEPSGAQNTSEPLASSLRSDILDTSGNDVRNIDPKPEVSALSSSISDLLTSSGSPNSSYTAKPALSPDSHDPLESRHRPGALRDLDTLAPAAETAKLLQPDYNLLGHPAFNSSSQKISTPSRGVTHYTIEELCDEIRASPTLGKLSIGDLYRREIPTGVKHEFIIVRSVPYAGNPATWIRIDRAAKGYRDRFKLTSRYPADDTARIGQNENHKLMAGESRLRAHVVFTPPKAPTFLALADLLTVMHTESEEYRLFSENCYFFTSVLQGMLTDLYGGMLISGALGHEKLGTEVRERVRRRFTSTLPLGSSQWSPDMNMAVPDLKKPATLTRFLPRRFTQPK